MVHVSRIDSAYQVHVGEPRTLKEESQLILLHNLRKVVMDPREIHEKCRKHPNKRPVSWEAIFVAKCKTKEKQ